MKNERFANTLGIGQDWSMYRQDKASHSHRSLLGNTAWRCRKYGREAGGLPDRSWLLDKKNCTLFNLDSSVIMMNRDKHLIIGSSSVSIFSCLHTSSTPALYLICKHFCIYTYFHTHPCYCLSCLALHIEGLDLSYLWFAVRI